MLMKFQSKIQKKNQSKQKNLQLKLKNAKLKIKFLKKLKNKKSSQIKNLTQNGILKNGLIGKITTIGQDNNGKNGNLNGQKKNGNNGKPKNVKNGREDVGERKKNG